MIIFLYIVDKIYHATRIVISIRGVNILKIENNGEKC